MRTASRGRSTAGTFYCLIVLAAAIAQPTPGQHPAIASFDPDGTITWTNATTQCVAVVEAFSLATSGQWSTVYAELPTNLVSQTQVVVTNEQAWFRALNADNTQAPSGMVLIPGGSNSGTNPLGTGESHDSCVYPPTYSLTVGSFYMDRYEVTKALWDEVATWAASNGYDISAAGGSGKGNDHPVHYVTWYECVKWCNARTEYENETQGANRSVAYYTSSAMSTVYRTGQLNIEDDSVDWSHGYRLPTDEEWEYAARGGAASKRFPWGGDTISHSQANYYASTSYSYDLSSGGYHPLYNSGGSPYTSPVGSFEAGKNGYELYDMAGNVWEWCWDWHPCFAGYYRVIRGGGWITGDGCRVGYRTVYFPGPSGYDVGFRAVLPPGQ